MSDANPSLPSAVAFVDRWKTSGGTERANYQLFLQELCDLLAVPKPQPQGQDARDHDYVFERRITFQHGDGSETPGFIDLYRRGAFVCEAKKLKQAGHTKGFSDALLRARSQAESYARALPVEEGRPPFLLVVDVGNCIELYAEFSRSGATYTPFPDPSSHRIRLTDLLRDDVRERLRQVWLAPLSLDPSRESARVTREIASRLAQLAKSLEASGHPAESVAQFLMRCLFTMFAEDVRLLPEDAFRNLLNTHRERPDIAMRMLGQLWKDMDGGGFSAVLAEDVLRFNGKLFKQPDVLPLDRDQIGLLIEAAKADWKHVEPAIFGTLLERALSPQDRHKLGAHYTPRAYVERLVLPTVIEPLRQQWRDVQAAALTLASEDKSEEAIAALRQFHHQLCTVRVLDPACGSGNFLYVTLEHLKRLEGEVLNTLDDFGYRQTGLAIDGERADASAGETVDPHNLLGIELNPRAAAIAEVVLWIGYLQWHFRTRGNVHPPVPVIRDFRNIENRDAVLAYDREETVLDADGKPVSRWDGVTFKTHPVTGEDVPDESAKVVQWRYVNARQSEWPVADFIVGNPPFIGTAAMRQSLGDGYTEALRAAWPTVPESADFVMYWWHKAADLTRRGNTQRFGFITTNSLKQTFNRRVLEQHLNPPAGAKSAKSARSVIAANATTPNAAVTPANAGVHASPVDSRLRGNDKEIDVPSERGDADVGLRGNEKPLSIVWAIPDHPWVDAASGAAVRIAMTVGQPCDAPGMLESVVAEGGTDGDAIHVELTRKRGRIHADLSIGAEVVRAKALRANGGISQRGLELGSAGFIVTPDEAARLQPCERIRPYRNGRDLTDAPRGVLLIDLYGLTADETRSRYPAAYQWLLERVKPERDQNRDPKLREYWWLHRRLREDLRAMLADQPRYIATVETSKHRTFQFLDASIAPDNMLVCIALADAYTLGVLSSQVHIFWALAAGGTLEDRPRYNKTRCFDPFPFPTPTETQAERIRTLAEQLDTHRKRQQAAHPGLTLTGMYNVLEALREGRELSAKERVIHSEGLVSVLRQLHDELDAAVLDAYGWTDLLPDLRIAHSNEAAPNGDSRSEARRRFDEAVLERLVALNAERVAEEARGVVRWLRPAFQQPGAERPPIQASMDITDDDDVLVAQAEVHTPVTSKPQAWPKDVLQQVRAVASVLQEVGTPMTSEQIAERFSGRGPWKKRLPALLETLVTLGRAREQDGRYRAAR